MSVIDTGRVAVITGAASGIGLGLARACAARGMRVVAADLDAARATQAAASLDGDAIAIGCDVRELDDVEALRDFALAKFGGIDLVCNNAGVGLARPLSSCGDQEWSLLLDVNLRGVINGVRTFLPLLTEQGSGHLSATASLSGLVGDPDLVVYGTTKFAVVGMFEALALELHRDHPGVTASVLCPGPVATDLLDTSGAALVAAGTEPADDDDVRSYLAGGAAPDQVGELAIAGIEAGHFWLLPHPELTFEIMDPRHEAMQRGQLYVPPDWTTQ